jgi:hypothetical protein
MAGKARRRTRPPDRPRVPTTAVTVTSMVTLLSWVPFCPAVSSRIERSSRCSTSPAGLLVVAMLLAGVATTVGAVCATGATGIRNRRVPQPARVHLLAHSVVR